VWKRGCAPLGRAKPRPHTRKSKLTPFG
jgi:hypothetical protein